MDSRNMGRKVAWLNMVFTQKCESNHTYYQNSTIIPLSHNAVWRVADCRIQTKNCRVHQALRNHPVQLLQWERINLPEISSANDNLICFQNFRWRFQHLFTVMPYRIVPKSFKAFCFSVYNICFLFPLCQRVNLDSLVMIQKSLHFLFFCHFINI